MDIAAMARMRILLPTEKLEWGPKQRKTKDYRRRMLIATPYALSAHERGQLGPVDYLAGSGDVWESRLKAEG